MCIFVIAKLKHNVEVYDLHVFCDCKLFIYYVQLYNSLDECACYLQQLRTDYEELIKCANESKQCQPHLPNTQTKMIFDVIAKFDHKIEKVYDLRVLCDCKLF